MADKNIQMTQRNTDNTGWDNLFPKSIASNIAVADAENHFTGTDVESVLVELFTNANNGKAGEASAIGSPALSTDSFATLNGYIQTDKNTLATNLTSKGQASSGAESLASLVAKVANISTDSITSLTAGTGTTLYNNATVVAVMAVSLTKFKEFVINKPGSIRVSFDMNGYSGGTTYLQLYKNGQPIGTLRTRAVTAYTTYTEDLAGFIAGDKLQLYGYCTPSTDYAGNFKNLILSISNALPYITVNQ